MPNKAQPDDEELLRIINNLIGRLQWRMIPDINVFSKSVQKELRNLPMPQRMKAVEIEKAAFRVYSKILYKAAARSNKVAQTRAYKELQRYLFKIALYRSQSREVAEEVTQETLIALSMRIKHLSDPSSLMAMATLFLFNRLRDYNRRNPRPASSELYGQSLSDLETKAGRDNGMPYYIKQVELESYEEGRQTAETLEAELQEIAELRFEDLGFVGEGEYGYKQTYDPLQLNSDVELANLLQGPSRESLYAIFSNVLSEKEEHIVEELFFNSTSLPELARETGLSPKQIQNITRRALSKLRRSPEFLAFFDRDISDTWDYYYKLGRTADSFGDLSRAIKNLEKAREILSQKPMNTGTSLTLAEVDYYLGRSLKRAGRWHDAVKSQKLTFDLAKRAGYIQLQARAFYELGHLYHLTNNFELAVLHYKDACRLFKRSDDLPGMAASKESLGTLELQLQFLLEAKHDLEEAKSMFTKLNMNSRVVDISKLLSLLPESYRQR